MQNCNFKFVYQYLYQRESMRFQALNLTESKIRYAMANTSSNRAAAIFLNVAYNSYKKYASYYIDEETGISLFEMHKNQEGKNIHKGKSVRGGYIKLMEILEGKYPDYPPDKLRDRLLKDNFIEYKCANPGCSYNDEERIKDYAKPLKLNWIDGDKTNHKRNNLEFLCYNCYFLTVGNFNGNKVKFQDL